jgi:hypothetical protein
MTAQPTSLCSSGLRPPALDNARLYLPPAPLLLAFARSLQDGQVIFFGSRLMYSRSACAPQIPGGKRVTLNISSALASA